MLNGRLALLTPEGTRIALTPAGPGLRAMAWGIDLMVWIAILLLFQMTIGATLMDSKLGRGLFLLVLFVSYWGYPILCEVYAGGRTLGKRWMGLEVVRADGLPVGWRESSLRNLLLAADFLPFAYLTGLVAMLTDQQFRRMGDLVAGTLVVYRHPPRPRRTAPNAEPEPLPWPLAPQHQSALLDFAERSTHLAPARCMELADLAQPLTGLTGEAGLEKLRRMAAGLVR